MPENKPHSKTLENIQEARQEFTKKINKLKSSRDDHDLQPIYEWMITEFIPLAKNLVYWKEAQMDFRAMMLRSVYL